MASENMYWIMQQGDELSIMINHIFPRKGVLNVRTVNSIQIALKYW